MKFAEIIREIQGLKEVKYVAYHVFEDEYVPKTLISVEDVEGKVLEIMTQDIFGYNDLQLFVLISVLLNKVMDSVVLPYAETLADDINAARKKYPYTGEELINEERTRKYDHVVPERKF